MAYNHGREDRKWRIWKEAEEKLLRECGVDEVTIEQIRIADRADFNSNRRFYRWTNDVAEYLEDMAFVVLWLCGNQLAMFFVESAQAEVIANVRLFLVCNSAFYIPLAFVNIVRFLIQGMGYSKFAILAGDRKSTRLNSSH